MSGKFRAASEIAAKMAGFEIEEAITLATVYRYARTFDRSLLGRGSAVSSAA